MEIVVLLAYYWHHQKSEFNFFVLCFEMQQAQ